MKKIILASTIALAMSSITVSAQTKVEGVFKDSVKNEVEPYATVRVFREGNMEKPVAMSLTGENGEINQMVEGTGNFVMTISSIGKLEVRRPFTINGESTLKLGDVCTADDAKQLSGVEVVAQKPIVKMETDKMTYNVQQDEEAQALTVLDMLRKVPMVTVDAQDNIMVKGSSSFKILVDGKPNIQLQSNAKQILKAIPASAIQKIEVITNPGAKYDAEGVGGVLNLITQYEEGNNDQANAKSYNGEVSARASNRGVSASTYIAGQNKKLTYSLNVYGGTSHLNGYEMSDEREQLGTDNSTVASHMKSDLTNPYTGGTLALGYDIDTKDAVNASVGFNYYSTKLQGTTSMALTGKAYGNGLAYNYDATTKESNLGITAGADWQHFFNADRTHNFTLSYQFSNSPDHQKNYRYYQEDNGINALGLNDSYSNNYTNAAEHTIQADYTLPMAEGQTLNAGAKYILRKNHADADYYFLDANGNYADPATSLKYDNNQQIVAGYVEHSGSYGKWSTREGVRYEHTWENIDYPALSEQNFKKNYGNLVPSLSVSYRMGNSTNLGVNYSLRIKRPGISYMNPYKDPSDATSVTYGNPDLKVENAHFVDIVFNHYGPKFMMNATLSQCFCNNQISAYSFADADGKLNTTYGNNVKNRWTNFNTWMRIIAGKKTSISLNGYLGYGDIRSEQLDIRNHGWQANGSLMLEQQLPWKIKWDIAVMGSTRSYDIQGYTGGYSMAYMMLNRNFCKDRLSVTLIGMSPLTGKLKINDYKHSSQFIDHSTTTLNNMQTIQVSVSWKFGNINKQFGGHKSMIKSDFGESQSQGQQVSSMSSKSDM